jgi:hypothetical protein
MKKILPALLALFMLAAFSPMMGSMRGRTHSSVSGSKYSRFGIYSALINDPLLSAVAGNLSSDLITAGSYAPDTWRRWPYLADRGHSQVYTKEQGAYWLAMAAKAKQAGAWDNVSYFLGVASHYWVDAVTMPHHDNARAYFESIYGAERGYNAWYELHSHFETQMYYYSVLLSRDNYCDPEYQTLESYIEEIAMPILDEFILKTKGPGLSNKDGWLFEWADGSSSVHYTLDYGAVHIEVKFPRDCEVTKSSVDLAAVLLYNAWVRVLDDVADNVDAIISKYRPLGGAEGG